MNIPFPGIWRSLFLAVVCSFCLPVVVVGLLLLVLMGGMWMPGLADPCQDGYLVVVSVLRVFGNGEAGHGLLVIALTFSLVGGLFDLFNCAMNVLPHCQPSGES